MTALAVPPPRLLPAGDVLLTLGFRVALILAVAAALQWLLFVIVRRGERWMVRAGHGGHAVEQRARTLGSMFRSVVAVGVWSVATIRVLDVFGWNVQPILAGAGILGVALGFGAQTLVRDLIAGFFLLVENQFAVGDLIEAGGVTATVEEVTLRFTRLRDFHGYVHYVPNGEMKIVTNRSRGWNRIAVDVLVASDQDLDRALAVCREVVREMNADPAWTSRLLDPIEVWGVESLVGQEVQLRMVLRARPGPDAPEAARELRRRVHLALATAQVRTRSSREVPVAGSATPRAPSTSGAGVP